VAVADQGALFEQEETLTVGQVTTRLTRAVAAAFPAEVWVRGEVQGLRPANASGHVYLTLCEKARGRDTATVSVALFRQSRARIDRALAEHPGFRLANGLEVRVRGRVQYAYGRVQLVLSEIDPVHTLGRLAAERDRTLAALRAEGLLDRNAALALPFAPLRLALVTSDGSAACHDVLHELEGSGLGFAVRVVDARVQGQGAEASVLAALTRALAARPDVVLVVRGGGSRTDLATFDRERIARAIASAPVPVLTGIGHETDISVADAVAHTAFKTPTACAAAVVERLRQGSARAEAAWAGVENRATTAGRRAEEQLDVRAGALAARATAGVVGAGSRTGASATRLGHLVALGLAGAEAALEEGGRRLRRSAGAVLGTAEVRAGATTTRLDPARLDAALRRDEAHLATATRHLARTATGATTAAAASLDVLAARAAAVDPARALARGWSITRTTDGALVRSATGLAPGTALRTTLADGTVASTVDGAEARDRPEAENPS
jgi:exodeoxyribonuclease VII large subunit